LKLVKYREVEEDRMKALHSSIDKIRINTNLFIHGLWTFHESENGLVFVCEIRKVEFKKVTRGFVKVLNKFLEFKPKDFEEELSQIKNSSRIANELIDSLEKSAIGKKLLPTKVLLQVGLNI
jgi:hypothetical protein